MINIPPANSFESMVLPESRARDGRTRSRKTALSSISGLMRWREFRFASSTVGCTASIGLGAWAITKPSWLPNTSTNRPDFCAAPPRASA